MSNVPNKSLACLLGLNAAWHTAAAFYFLRHPLGILRKYFNIVPSPSHGFIVRYLGAINTGFSLLALLALWRYRKNEELQSSDFWVLSLANFSQFALDVAMHWNGMAKRALFAQITVPDGLFFLVDAIAAFYLLSRGK